MAPWRVLETVFSVRSCFPRTSSSQPPKICRSTLPRKYETRPLSTTRTLIDRPVLVYIWRWSTATYPSCWTTASMAFTVSSNRKGMNVSAQFLSITAMFRRSIHRSKLWRTLTTNVSNCIISALHESPASLKRTCPGGQSTAICPIPLSLQ